jgi:hypothetical protein
MPGFALGPGVHTVGEGSAAPGRGRDRPDPRLGVLQDAGEHAEAAAAEVLGDILHLQRIAKIGLVGAVFRDRLPERDAREATRRDLTRAGELLEHTPDHRLDRGEHVLLGGEAHFQVELVEFARGPVGAGVLVAEARGDLEVAVEARDHQQLLELLGGLGQRVELARMHPRGHQEVARALRRGGRQDRRLELGETGVHHPPPDRGDDPRA